MMAVGLTAAMTVGSISFQGLSVNAAGLPTTDGHNKYVNSEVFNVISDDSFGTKELENPLFDKTTGSSDISNLQVPTLAYDDTSIALVWDKPEKYDNVEIITFTSTAHLMEQQERIMKKMPNGQIHI